MLVLGFVVTLVQNVLLAAVVFCFFTAVSTSDATYRRTFVDPAFEEVEEALLVRHAYLATGRDDNPGAPDNPDNMAENSAS